MSPPEVWGPAVWTLFHTLIEKVNDQAYPFIKVQLFGQIRRICGFLPCPECSADATNFLAKVNINDLKTKIDFRNTFYMFHNMVNSKKRKPLFNYSKLTSYNNYGIVYVVNNFISKYNTKGNMKLLAESFQRKLVLGEFKSWFLNDLLAAQAVREKAIKDAERIAKSKLAAKRRSTIINKYGATLGKIILEGKVRIGMTKAMAIDAWGKPNDINKTITRYAVSEQWVYDGGYLYFENGKLTTIQN